MFGDTEILRQQDTTYISLAKVVSKLSTLLQTVDTHTHNLFRIHLPWRGFLKKKNTDANDMLKKINDKMSLRIKLL